MSYTEVHSLLKLGRTFNPPQRFDASLGYGGQTWITESARIRRVDFRHGCSVLFWFDVVTDQCRVFLDAELAEIDGKLVIVRGYEIACSAWN